MKRKSLLFKVACISLIMAVLAMISSGAILYVLFRHRAVESMEKNLKSTIDICSFQVYDYYAYPWLLDYWKDHGTEMEAPPFGGDQDQLTAWVMKTAYLFGLIPKRVTVEEIEEMSPEEQKEFAEFCYVELYRDLAYYRNIFGIDTIIGFLPEDDGEEAFRFFVIDAKDEGKNYLDLERSLGTELPFHPENHPEVQRMLSEQNLTSDMEFYRSSLDGKEYAALYGLIGKQGEIKGILALTKSMDRLNTQVWSDVLSFEKWITLGIASAIFILLLTLYLISIRPTKKLQESILGYAKEKDSASLTRELENLMQRGDEIGALSRDVNEMACEIEDYYQETIRLTDAKAQMKSELLLAQIRPHFIYNCLTTIRYRLEEPEKAEELLNHFAGVLRSSIDILEERGCIPAKRELKTVEDYLFMEKERFGENLSVVMELTDTDFSLPAFSVQMLVENAVNHGVRMNEDGCGTVWIRSRLEEDVHVIEVEDDGPGLPAEISETDDRSHIGINHVKERLSMMCGGTLEISGTPGRGTLARIRIARSK